MSALVTEDRPAVVQSEVVGETGLICLSHPPVNALGAAVRQGLVAEVPRLNADPRVKVIALMGAGRVFSAGADLAEFGKSVPPPTLPDALAKVAESLKPVIAVLHGVAFGGGLELALAAQLRIGLPGLRLSLPEVKLGLIPGAGGTQRLPRVIGTAAAVDMICSGREVVAEEALALGLVDHLANGSPRESGLTAAQAVLEGQLSPRRTDSLEAVPDPKAIEAARQKLLSRQPVLAAPLAALEAIYLASEVDVAEGMTQERAGFLKLRDGPDRQGFVHAFRAERATAKIPEATLPAREIATVGVIGGGTMGVGIATAFLIAGLSVRLIETKESRAATARANILRNLDGALTRDKLDATAHVAATAALTTSTELESLAAMDLVIETVFEDMAVKTEIFGKLGRICGRDTILATNTSYLDINEIAGATDRPEAVIGLHFFSPAHVMRLIEVVVGDRTAPELVSTAFALARRMRKVPVRSGVCDGFIGNRILAGFRKATDYLVLDGAGFDQVDRALEGFGFAMGPFAVSDLAGLDIGLFTRRRKAATRPLQERYSRVADRIAEAGWLGRKTGRGYYLYEAGKRTGVNPEAAQILTEERAGEGITPRAFTDQQIIDRCMTAMISESIRVLDEGIAPRPIDIDAVKLFGYGFPRHLGGPMNLADRIGAPELLRRIESYAQEDRHFWQVPDRLRQMAAMGETFAALNEG